MRTMFKYAAAATLAGALALGMATPSQARHGWNAAAIGFGVGALAGAAAANSYYNGYYGPDYYYGAGPYAYDYAPGYVYEPVPTYVAPAPVYGYGGRCWISTDSDRGYGYYGTCR
jgi:hypothetical protein